MKSRFLGLWFPLVAFFTSACVALVVLAFAFPAPSEAAVYAGGQTGARGEMPAAQPVAASAYGPEYDGVGAEVDTAAPSILLEAPDPADPILQAELLARGFDIVWVLPHIETLVVRPSASWLGSESFGGEPIGGRSASRAREAAYMPATLEALEKIPGVEAARVATYKYASVVPNDPYYPFVSDAYPGQWAMERVGLEQAWEWVTGSPAVTLAVLDSGLAYDIDDFNDRIVNPYSTLSLGKPGWKPYEWDDVFGHGSGVTGIAAATGNNGYGIAGAAWGVSLMPVHFTNNGRVDLGDFVAAITYAVDGGADVINISYGSSTTESRERRAIRHAVENDVVVVAAAGNRGVNQGIDYPAALPGVIAVGATDALDRRATFSCTGPELDLVAPGVSILTYTANATTYGLTYTQGTSFSSPLVAGVAALMLSVNPHLTPAQIEQMLGQSADDLGPSGFDEHFGYGLLNAHAALALAEATAPSTTTTLPPTTTTTTVSPTTTTTTVPPRTFSDVPDDGLYSVAIMGLAREGVVEGYTDGTFRPLEPLWRAQFAKMVSGLLELQVHEDLVPPFGDLGLDNPSSLYPHQYVAAAAQAGITYGTAPGRFSPYRELSRAQAATMIVRGAQGLFPGLLTIPPPEYEGSLGIFDATHGPSMRLAEYNGLLVGLQGYGPGWDPWRNTDRGEVAQMMWQFWLLRL